MLQASRTVRLSVNRAILAPTIGRETTFYLVSDSICVFDGCARRHCHVHLEVHDSRADVLTAELVHLPDAAHCLRNVCCSRQEGGIGRTLEQIYEM
jgi:hypothetical protein